MRWVSDLLLISVGYGSAPLGLGSSSKPLDFERFEGDVPDHFVDANKMIGGSRRSEKTGRF
jgi:hypothetical protein